MGDFSHLATNPGLVELVGHEAEVVRKFCMPFTKRERFRKINRDVAWCDLLRFRGEQSAQGLGRVTRDLIHPSGERCGELKVVTVEQCLYAQTP